MSDKPKNTKPGSETEEPEFIRELIELARKSEMLAEEFDDEPQDPGEAPDPTELLKVLDSGKGIPPALNKALTQILGTIEQHEEDLDESTRQAQDPPDSDPTP